MLNNIQYCFTFILIIVSTSTALKILPSVDKTYEDGVKAYSEERWSKCIEQFEESLHLYKLYKSVVNNCRLRCNSEDYKSFIKENIEDLKIYERFFNVRDCLNQCQDNGFVKMGLNSTVLDSTSYNMEMRKPYQYLHVCYFQMNALPKAASAVYTSLLVNPDNEVIKQNLEYYTQQPEVDINEVVDLESEDYKIKYKLGLQAYQRKNWEETITSMEAVLLDYFSWENICRVECQRQPEQQPSSEFVSTVSNNMVSLIHCHQECQDRLRILGYKSGVAFLAEVLNYLQISYYRLDRYKEAAKAAASYLALLPDDEDMLENKKIYSSLVEKNAFEERSDIIHYYKRDMYEKKLIDFFHRGNYHTNSNAI